MKKILSSIVILGLFSPSFAIINPYPTKYNSIIQARATIQYPKIDLIIEKYMDKVNSLEKAEKIKNNILKLRGEYKLCIGGPGENILCENTKKTKIQYFLEELYFNLSDKIIFLKQKELEKKQEQKLEAVIQKAEAKTISENDKKSGEKEILAIQNILKNEINNFIDKKSNSLEKYLYVQEKGNMKINFSMDIGKLGNIDTKANLKDYISKTNFLDQELKTNFKFLINATNDRNENLNLNLSTYIDYIKKDGEIFLLLKDLKIGEKNIPKDIKISLDIFKNLYENNQNKFIKFPKNTRELEALKIIKNLNKESIKKQIALVLEIPLFVPYKKVGNKYYLIPSQDACNVFIKSISSINPYIYYGKNSCTKEIYQEMLIAMEDNNIEITLENKKLALNVNMKKEMEVFDGFMQFDSKELKQAKLTMIPPQTKYPEEKFLFNYEKNKEITSYFNIKKKDVFYNINIELDRINRVKQAKITGNINDYRSKLNYNFEYKNNKFSGSFENNSKNYLNDKIEKTTGKISGTTDSKKEIKTLDLEINSKMLQFILNLKNKNIDLKLNINDNKGNKIFSNSGTGKYDKDLFILNNKFELTKNPFDYEKAKNNAKKSIIFYNIRMLSTKFMLEESKGSKISDYILDGNKINFEKLGENEANFKNPFDNSDYLIFTDGENYEIFSYYFDENGNKVAIIYGKNYSSDSLVEINGKKIKDGDILEKAPEKKSEKITGEFNINSDLKDGNDNIDFLFNIKKDGKNIINFNLENKGKIEYKKSEIIAPKDYIEAEKIIQKMY